MLGVHQLAIGFLAQFDSIDCVAARGQISNLSNGVCRSVVQHGHRQHRRQAVRQTAAEDQVKARLLSVFVAID